MQSPINISDLTPQERIELAERLWDSLVEEDIELTSEQARELAERRDRLARDGAQGRPWKDIMGGTPTRGE